MREIIRTCLVVQFNYAGVPLQDRIYIAFGRYVTKNPNIDEEGIKYAINQIKSEFEFLEGVWNGKEKRQN